MGKTTLFMMQTNCWALPATAVPKAAWMCLACITALLGEEEALALQAGLAQLGSGVVLLLLLDKDLSHALAHALYAVCDRVHLLQRFESSLHVHWDMSQ